MTAAEKTAVILFNLGGPDSLKAVKPFLTNLFSDKAIIRLPWPARMALARLIAWRRNRKAQHIYAQMGGKSPILEHTYAQAEALQKQLERKGAYKVFFSMRYWHPLSAEVAQDVKRYGPDRIILLPLYPHYSTATTASSFTDWKRAAKRAGLSAPTKRVCCYPVETGFIAAHVERVMAAYWQASTEGNVRVLFSAHGLPEKIVLEGDPYKWQIEQTASAIVRVMAMEALDWAISYQSRVGPLTWIGPSTEEEIARAGEEGKSLVVVPISFVSEHSETLVELDIDYARLAEAHGVKRYIRVPALGVSAHYIETLAALCTEPLGKRICPIRCGGCPRKTEFLDD